MHTCFAFAALVSGIAGCSDSKSGADAGVDASTGPVDTGVPPGQAVVSDDGKVTAFVPEGALPAGTSLADLSVTAVAQADWPTMTSTSGEFRVLAAYSLEPDGLQLATPITLRLEVAGIPEGLAIFGLHETPTSVESPTPHLILPSTGSQVQFVDFEVTLFSRFHWVGESGFLKEVAVQPVDTGLDTSSIPVGTSFEMIGGVRVNRESVRAHVRNGFFKDDYTIRSTPNNAYDTDLVWLRASSNLTPAVTPTHRISSTYTLQLAAARWHAA